MNKRCYLKLLPDGLFEYVTENVARMLLEAEKKEGHDLFEEQRKGEWDPVSIPKRLIPGLYGWSPFQPKASDLFALTPRHKWIRQLERTEKEIPRIVEWLTLGRLTVNNPKCEPKWVDSSGREV